MTCSVRRQQQFLVVSGIFVLVLFVVCLVLVIVYDRTWTKAHLRLPPGPVSLVPSQSPSGNRETIAPWSSGPPNPNGTIRSRKLSAESMGRHYEQSLEPYPKQKQFVKWA
uniref:Uncharacterized protein n=2 Tax=Cyclophora tenuis TaxID=216820 RepID=A0A7S1D9Y6_CYCTE